MGKQPAQIGYTIRQDFTSLEAPEQAAYLKAILVAARGDLEAKLRARILWRGADSDIESIRTIEEMIGRSWNDPSHDSHPQFRRRVIHLSPAVKAAIPKQIKGWQKW